MADEYLDFVVFIEGGRDGKKAPKTIGWGKVENGEVKGRIDLTPTHGWDGSFKIQVRRERTQGGPPPARGNAPSSRDPEDFDRF